MEETQGEKSQSPNQLSLAEEACKLVYLNFGKEASQFYQGGFKEKAEKEMLQSLEDSLKELVGPEYTKSQMEKLWGKLGKENNGQ